MKDFKLVMTSGKSVNPGSSLSAYDAAILDVTVNIDQVLFDLDVRQLLGDKVRAFLQVFNANRGYVSTTTTAVVGDYLTNAINAYSYLVALLRSQNANKLTDAMGKPMNIVNKRVLPGSVTSNPILYLLNDTEVLVDDEIVISNAKWIQDYVSELDFILLPEFIKYHIEEMFSGLVINPYNSTSYIQFNPNTSDKLHEAFINALTTVKDLLTTHPDLIDVLYTLGFNKPNQSFMRDLSANTVLVYSNPSLILAFENSHALAGYFSDDDTDDLYRLPTSMTNFDYSSQMEFNVKDIWNILLYKPNLLQFTGNYQKERPMILSAVLKAIYNGTVNYANILPTGGRYTYESGLSRAKLDEAINKTSTAQSVWNTVIGIDPLFTKQVKIGWDSGRSEFIVTEQSISTLVNEGIDSWFYSSNQAKSLRQKLLVDLILGEDFFKSLKEYNDLWRQNAIRF